MIPISLKAEELFHIGSFPVTNSLVITAVVFLTLSVLGVLFRKRLSLIPDIFQNVLEIVIEFLLKLMDSVLGSRTKSEKYLPLVATIFLVVILSNWLGLVPGVGSIGISEFHEGEKVFIPIFRAPSADLNFTLALAISAVFGINIFGIIAIGFFKYFKRFLRLKTLSVLL